MEEIDYRLECLRLANGDVAAAKEMLSFLLEAVEPSRKVDPTKKSISEAIKAFQGVA